jgi:uncharacterized membrane protein YphA (DoxX/SURF4 family)
MNVWTRVFLIALRIAIGWHFLFEGVEKWRSIERGTTETPSGIQRPFNSAGFLRESTGPFAGFFRSRVADLDQQALDRSDVQGRRISPALDKHYDDYFARFVALYELDERQAEAARVHLEKAKTKVLDWLTKGEWEPERTFPGVTTKIKQSIADRVRELKEKVRKVRETEQDEMKAMGRDVYGPKYRAMKADVAKMRNELLTDLDKPLLDAFDAFLDEQKIKSRGRVPPPPLSGFQHKVDSLLFFSDTPRETSPDTWWIDRVIMCGLLLAGSCLMLGLFSRLSSLAGAVFLLSLYLAMPPFPWLPENAKVTGHYLFVNEILIEMLALLVLTTVPTGRWAGLDALVSYLNPFRRRGEKADKPPMSRPPGLPKLVHR